MLAQWRKSYGVPATAYKIVGEEPRTTQRLSHQLIHFSFVRLSLHYRLAIRDIQWVPLEDLPRYPFPRTLQSLVQTLQKPRS